MLVSAYFISVVKKIHPKEIEFVKSYLDKVMLPDVASLGFNIVEKALNYDLSAMLLKLDRKAKSKLSYSTKLNILHFIRGLCMADGDFSEEKELNSFSNRLGVSRFDHVKIASFSFNNNLNPSAVLKDLKRLYYYDIKISDYIVFNKLMGTNDGAVLGPLTQAGYQAGYQAGQSDVEGFFLSPDVIDNKIEALEKGVLEKTFDERINEFKDKRIKQQIDVLDHKLHLFLDVLSQKMEPSELTYKKYKKSFEQVYKMALENIKDVVSSQKIIESIDIDALKKELYTLNKEEDAERAKMKQDRLSLFEDESERLNEILINNERAIQEMEEVTIEIGRLKGTKGEDQHAIINAIKELEEWTDNVGLYNKK
jgi:hypothetical protein